MSTHYYPNTEGLRRLMDRGLKPDSPYRAYVTHDGFWMDPHAVKKQVWQVLALFGDLHSEQEALERALFRVLTLGPAPEGTLQSKQSSWIFWALVGAAAVALGLALLFLPLKAHAQDQQKAAAPARSAPPRGASKDAPVTVLPLDAADKVRVLRILRQQDQVLLGRRDHQLAIDALDKQMDLLQAQISQLAQDLAASNGIDTSELILDLDQLAWITKEIK